MLFLSKVVIFELCHVVMMADNDISSHIDDVSIVEENISSFSPLLSTLANTDSAAVARRGVVAGPLPHFKPDTTTAAALAPWRPGSPAAIPVEQNARWEM